MIAATPNLAWDDALRAAAVFCVDPEGVGGIAVRAGPGPIRERWLAALREGFPNPSAMRRVPLNVGEERLLGGLDLTASLRAGRPVADAGLLAEADGGAMILSMAERIDAPAAAHLTAAMDTREVRLQRDGLALSTPTAFGTIALDEGINPDERPPAALLDRLGMHLDLSLLSWRDAEGSIEGSPPSAEARCALTAVADSPELLSALSEAAWTLGIPSLRAVLFALRTARASAALAGRGVVERADVEFAARTVLAPRAEMQPEQEPDGPPPAEEATSQSASGDPSQPDERDETPSLEPTLADIVVAVCRTALRLPISREAAERNRAAGHPPPRGGRRISARAPTSNGHGRPAGARPGKPGRGARINLIETLRAAAPYQRLRIRARPANGRRSRRRIEVAPDDLRITRLKPRRVHTTVFAVDASGSSALNRLGEAKGAIELLLAESYVRRDQVALIAFRQAAAEVILPPTRSLARARRLLVGLPGGGGTPLAAGIDAAASLSEALARRGENPLNVVMTDGRANVALDGSPGRAQAWSDTLLAARRVRASALPTVLVDTSPRPSNATRQLAAAMNARHIALPYADARNLLGMVRELGDSRVRQGQSA